MQYCFQSGSIPSISLSGFSYHHFILIRSYHDSVYFNISAVIDNNSWWFCFCSASISTDHNIVKKMTLILFLAKSCSTWADVSSQKPIDCATILFCNFGFLYWWSSQHPSTCFKWFGLLKLMTYDPFVF